MVAASPIVATILEDVMKVDIFGVIERVWIDYGLIQVSKDLMTGQTSRDL